MSIPHGIKPVGAKLAIKKKGVKKTPVTIKATTDNARGRRRGANTVK